MTENQLRGWSRVLLGVWVTAVVAVSIQATLNQTNNFATFRSSWFDLLEGIDPYAPSARHEDFFKYSPTFAVLFAPFAVLPFWAGVLAWNAVNAGALYWALGKALSREHALAARVLVLFDTIGAMQNVQSNALVAGLMVIACVGIDARRELRAATAIGLGTAIKLFPVVAASYAIFRPYRVPRFAIRSVLVGAGLIALPLVVVSPSTLAGLYASWGRIQRVDAVDRGYSVMQQLHLWFGYDLPNWPVQLLAIVVLLAPLLRISYWGLRRFRLLYLASLLMFCVLFNHKAESPTFVVAVTGVAIWFVVSPRRALDWSVLGVVVVGTILSSSDAMPNVIQEGFFEPYRLKIWPVLFAWILTQVELWRRTTPAPLRAHGSAPAAAAT